MNQYSRHPINQLLPMVFLTGLVSVVSMLGGCEYLPFYDKEEPKKPAPINRDLQDKRTFIPIIYSDRVVELDPRTGEERVIPDQDLIVEDGKVWGRYIRLGDDIKFTMSYHNHLCAPVLTTDIETIGETSRPARSFSRTGQSEEKKYDDCKEEEMKKAANRIQRQQVDYQEFNRETLKSAPSDVIQPSR